MAVDKRYSVGQLYELERLKAEIAQERQMKEMLEKSSSELKQTVEQLEKRIGSIDAEGNEWKTRFELQQEINQQLSKVSLQLQQKMEETKQDITHLRQNMGADEISMEPTPYAITNMQKQKTSLEEQIRDLEWRLDQESKAYHKANDERKQYMVEIASANFTLDNMLKKSESGQQGSPPANNGALRNIPEDQRVIDQRRGPIKKTAAVKSLPKLDGDSP